MCKIMEVTCRAIQIGKFFISRIFIDNHIVKNFVNEADVDQVVLSQCVQQILTLYLLMK
jgi:hypothetical protein